LGWLADRGLRDAAREAASGPLGGEQVFVHGDYQHFNVLWGDREGGGEATDLTARTVMATLGRSHGHYRAELVTVTGQVSCPPPGRT